MPINNNIVHQDINSQTEQELEMSSGQKLPAPIRGKHFPTHPGLERRAITTYVIANDSERFSTDTGLAVRHVEGDNVTQIELRPRGHILDAETLQEVRQMASSMTPVDDDILDILMSNAALNYTDSEGLFTIEIDAILDERRKGKKQKKSQGKAYSSGYREQFREDVLERLRNLESLYILHSERKMRNKPVHLYEKVVDIRRVIIDSSQLIERVIAIQYALSPKLTQWINGVLLTPRKLLELDGRNGAPAKALGRYLFQRSGFVDADGYFRCGVRELLDDLRRTTIDKTGKHSGRPRQHLERDLEELFTSEIIMDWSYVETNVRSAEAALGKGYRVAEAWLELHLQIKLQSLPTVDSFESIIRQPLTD